MRAISRVASTKAQATIPADQYFRELEAWAKQKRSPETEHKAEPGNNLINLADARRGRQ